MAYFIKYADDATATFHDALLKNCTTSLCVYSQFALRHIAFSSAYYLLMVTSI